MIRGFSCESSCLIGSVFYWPSMIVDCFYYLLRVRVMWTLVICNWHALCLCIILPVPSNDCSRYTCTHRLHVASLWVLNVNLSAFLVWRKLTNIQVLFTSSVGPFQTIEVYVSHQAEGHQAEISITTIFYTRQYGKFEDPMSSSRNPNHWIWNWKWQFRTMSGATSSRRS